MSRAKQDLVSPGPWEGLRIFKPKTKRDFAWIAVVGFGVRKLGGVGDSQEEAALALLENVLVTTEALFARAVQYNLVEQSTLTRVRGLNMKFIAELRQLHRIVVEDNRWESLLRDEDSDTKSSTLQVDINEEDVDDDFL